VIGGLTAVPLAAGTALRAPAAHAEAGTASAFRIPAGLLPGGAFDRFVANRAAQDQFSGNVALVHRGRPVLSRSYGMADKQKGVANRADTIVNLASITKVLTALAVARLVQDGRVSFHEKLGAYLDGFPAEVAATVTVHQLLTHTSGMGDYSRSPEFPAGLREWDSAAATMAGVMDIIRRSPLQFSPGARFGYSNSGFFVLGALVERVSGQSYFDYVHRHVFAPAGMTDAGFYTRPQVLANERIAHPYMTGASGTRTDFTTSEYFGFIGGPADGAYATATDLSRLAMRLCGGGVLLPAFTRLVTAGKVALSPDERPPEPSRSRSYGYGFRASIVGDHSIFGHSGSGAGKATNLDIVPGPDWVVVVLSNYDTSIDPIVRLARQLITDRRETE
jgi:CubicO group peptidase (beta-lactamase class C family)